jgi:hypothetical protein
MDYATFMHDLFWACVLLLKWGAIKLGMTYEELNIWVFVVIHPAITLFFMHRWWVLRAHNKHISKILYLDDSKK